MKNLTALLFTLLTLTIQAQEKKYPMPDYDNVPYFYDEATNTLQPLEKLIYHVETKAKGLWGAGQYIVVPGAAAKLRYSNTQKIQFIVHFDDARTEPSTLYQLAALTVNTNNNNSQREYMVKSQGVGHAETNNTQIPMDSKRIGEGLYLITFLGEILTGEYAISIEKTKQGYAFGIDGEGNSNVPVAEKPRPKDPIARAIYDAEQKKKAENKGKQ